MGDNKKKIRKARVSHSALPLSKQIRGVRIFGFKKRLTFSSSLGKKEVKMGIIADTL